MHLIRLLLAFACIAAGAAIGALNTSPVRLDLGFVQWPTTLGVAVIVALLVGVVLGGLVCSASVVLPLRNQLRKARRAGKANTDGNDEGGAG